MTQGNEANQIYRICKTVPYINKCRDRFDGHLYLNQKQNKNENQATRLGVESENLRKTCFPQNAQTISYG